MLILDIFFTLTLFFTFGTNLLLIIFLLRRSAISIIFFVFGSILLTYALFLARFAFETVEPSNIVLFAGASLLIGFAIIIVIFNLPELTPSQRFWQRVSGIFGGIMISSTLTGSFYPQVIDLLFVTKNSYFSLLLITIPPFISFLSAFFGLLSLFVANKSLTQRMVSSRFDIILIMDFVFLLAFAYTIIGSGFLPEKIFTLIMFGILLIDTHYLFLIAYFIQRFPVQPMFLKYLEDGTFGWFISRMGDKGPEMQSSSTQFRKRWEWDKSFLERLAVTVVSFIGMGHEDMGYEGLNPSFFSMYQNGTFVGLAIPMRAKAELEDPRFRGQTLLVLTLLIPYDYILSLNPDGVKKVQIDPQLLEYEGYVVETCLNVLKRIFD